MYNGLEIDMLNLGDADSILVSRWTDGLVTRILVDGGRKKDAETVQSFLDSMEINHIDHLVCTHIHDDHAKGLVELVNSQKFTIGQAWLHIPSNHIDREEMTSVLEEAGRAGIKFAQVITASLQTLDSLQNALEARNIPIAEPFEDQKVGFMTVCGPSAKFYREKLQEFSNFDKLREKNARIVEQNQITSLMEALSRGSEEDPGLMQNPVTDPENEVSVILGTKYNNETYLLTADAGVQGLTAARDAYVLSGLRFMQIPHHGSRRNITQELIDYFAPQTAFVSAVGDRKHPRIAVVNAFIKAGAKVYSTHYKPPHGGNKWHHNGTVPDRPNYSSATPLYD